LIRDRYDAAFNKVGVQCASELSQRIFSITVLRNSATLTLIIQLQTECSMNINLSIVPIVSLIAGVLILVMPSLLPRIVAIYLIVVGIVGLFGMGNLFR
jgi:hypothetical protein